MKEKSVLEMRNIHKSFPGVRALQAVDFTLCEGEIHALMGENGAGKSTLIKVLTGVYEKDEGEIYLKGMEKAAVIKSPRDAQNLGISTVYQEITLCPNLTVAENMYIGRGKTQMMDWKKMNADADAILDKLGIPAGATQQLSDCSIAIQQMVAIARAVDMDCKVLILDEPTSSLDESEVEKLFGLMRDLRERGVGIIFVTHFLDQVYEVCDRITVLRNGKYVGTYETEHLPRVELVGKMLGKDYDKLNAVTASEDGSREDGEILVEMDHVSGLGTIEDFDLTIRRGEVLGLSGLLGSGRSETARLIFGVDQVEKGQLKMKGKKAALKTPLDAIREGVAFCPENRKTEGIIGDLSIRDNIILALQAKKGMFAAITRQEAERIADEYIEKLEIKTPSRDQLIKNLSGGNQQKVILARWLATDPDLLMLDEPTRGIDIGTKAEIQKIVVDLARKGMSVLFISSEIDEMLRCCKRMVVLRNLKKVTELKGQEISEGEIMRYIAGGEANEKVE